MNDKKPGTKKVTRFEFRIGEDLKQLVEQAAADEGMPLNEFISGILAAHFERPDLARVPRRWGRKEMAATNGK